MRALYFIVDSLVFLYQVVLLLRLLMQLTRADFRNPVARAIVQLTDPLVRPLRRLLPPLRGVDSASVVAILLVSLLKIWVLQLLLGNALPGIATLLHGVLFDSIDLVLRTYLYSMILNAILSLVAQGNYSPVQSILASICNPVLNPIRKYIPSIAGLDLSPLWACIAIQALLIFLRLR
ncbi:MAG: YggT family protein [Steroidobacteraceae bacterium]